MDDFKKLTLQTAMMGSERSPHRISLNKLYASLIEQAEHEDPEHAIESYKKALQVRAAGIAVQPLLWNEKNHDEMLEERIFLLSREIYGDFSEKTILALTDWADHACCGPYSSGSPALNKHLQITYDHLCDSNPDKALDILLWLGRSLLRSGDNESAVSVFTTIYEKKKAKNGICADTLASLHTLGWVLFQVNRNKDAAAVFFKEIKLRLQIEDAAGIPACEEALRLINK